jgi:hypothetical protein
LHWVRAGDLAYVEDEIHGLIIALKDFYMTVGAMEVYTALDAILQRQASHMYDSAARDERLGEIRRRFPGLTQTRAPRSPNSP